MKELDDLERSMRDSVKAPSATASMDPGVMAKVEAAQRAQIQRLRDYAKSHPDDALVKASQHLLPQADAPTWNAIGGMALTSFIWWSTSGAIGFPNRGGFGFSGKGGPNWAATSFTAPLIGGKFTVDPLNIAGSPQCNFYIGEGGFGTGVLVMNFWGMDGTPWGTVGGPVSGIGGGGITGILQLTW
jgi:hypothetical protein